MDIHIYNLGRHSLLPSPSLPPHHHHCHSGKSYVFMLCLLCISSLPIAPNQIVFCLGHIWEQQQHLITQPRWPSVFKSPLTILMDSEHWGWLKTQPSQESLKNLSLFLAIIHTKPALTSPFKTIVLKPNSTQYLVINYTNTSYSP